MLGGLTPGSVRPLSSSEVTALRRAVGLEQGDMPGNVK